MMSKPFSVLYWHRHVLMLHILSKQLTTVEVKSDLIMMGEGEVENTGVISFEVLQDS